MRLAMMLATGMFGRSPAAPSAPPSGFVWAFVIDLAGRHVTGIAGTRVIALKKVP